MDYGRGEESEHSDLNLVVFGPPPPSSEAISDATEFVASAWRE